jgi:arylsulfatase
VFVVDDDDSVRRALARLLRAAGFGVETFATAEAYLAATSPDPACLVIDMQHLRRDPYERAHVTSNTYWDWMIDRVFFLVPAQVYVGDFLATFQEFPPRQKPASFSIDQVLEKMQTSGGSK